MKFWNHVKFDYPYQKKCTKTMQNIYKNYTKHLICIFFVYKDVQIKILFDTECTNNVHQIPIHVYKKCTNCTKPIQSSD